MTEENKKRYQVQKVLLFEALANLIVLLIKLVVGLTSQSYAIIADALHSLTDCFNNIVALFVVRHSYTPVDSDHPYGHRKFETLAVFWLATLLTVLGLELILNVFKKETIVRPSENWQMILMLLALGFNIVVALWQRKWAKKLDSQILFADSHHTMADVITTVVVILSWQLSSMGYFWVDKVCTVFFSIFIFYLAFSLFKRAIPILVDSSVIDPVYLEEEVSKVEGVKKVVRIRSRQLEDKNFADVIVTVDASMSIEKAHEIADKIEVLLEEKFNISDVTVHIEPSK